MPRRIAYARLFDLDDLGAEIAEHHRGYGAGKQPGQV
jgi:hypothetical protein